MGILSSIRYPKSMSVIDGERILEPLGLANNFGFK